MVSKPAPPDSALRRLDLIEQQLDRMAQVSERDGPRLRELEQDLMQNYQSCGQDELAVVQLHVFGHAQRKGDRHLPAAAHYLLGQDFAGWQLGDVQELHA